jgi:hypothetical protein
MDLFFRWATPVVQRGYTQEQLQTEDLLPLPPTATPRACTADLWHQWSKVSTPDLLYSAVMCIAVVEFFVRKLMYESSS